MLEILLGFTLFAHVSRLKKKHIWSSICFITAIDGAWHSIFNALCTLTHNFGSGAIKLVPIEHYICVEEKLLYHDLDGIDTWGLKYYVTHQKGNVSIFIKMLFLNYFLKTFLPPAFSDGIYYVLNTCLHYWSSLVRHVAKNQSTIQMLLLLTYSLLV